MSCIITNHETIEVVLSYLNTNGVDPKNCQEIGRQIFRDNVAAYDYEDPLEEDDHEYDVSLRDQPLSRVLGCVQFLDSQLSDHCNYRKLTSAILLGKTKAWLLRDLGLSIEVAMGLPGYVWGVESKG